jgi:hypothetical protein
MPTCKMENNYCQDGEEATSHKIIALVELPLL